MSPTPPALSAVKQSRFSSTTSLLIVFLLVVCAMGAVTSVLYTSLDNIRNHRFWVDHSYQVFQELEAATSDLKDIETGQRGFSLTGMEDFLEPYKKARVSIDDHLRNLRQLTADNPSQQPRLDALQQKVEEMLDIHANTVETRRTGGLQAAAAVAATQNGRRVMEAIRDLTQQIGDEETRLLRKRTDDANNSQLRVDRSFTLNTVVIFALILAVYIFVRQAIIRQEAERLRLTAENWFKNGLSELGMLLRGEQTVTSLGDKALTFFSTYLGMQVGTVYSVEGGAMTLESAFAGDGQEKIPRRLSTGNGLAGEAVRQKQLLRVSDVPEGYIKVSSPLGNATPKELLLMPLHFQDDVVGVMELGSLQAFTDAQIDFLTQAQESISISLATAQSRRRLQDLLEETQRQAEELQVQQEELRVSNEELEAQANALKTSQDRLQIQQEELRQTNEELEQQARAVDVQRQALETRNADLAATKLELEGQALELERTSRYKSEFLANMSHELRTPLNSLLLLATLLAENRDKTLSGKQIDYAKTIIRAGNDLLNLINDILDLSKVEAGKVELQIETVALPDVAEALDSTFRPLADQKGLKLELHVARGLPRMRTDRQRLEQILKNLISNAVKFTETGSVALDVEKGKDGEIVFSVTDTGIGIPAEKQAMVFEAFQQADGSTSRAYGGTGLGLTISRELASLLGGHIELSSEVGRGSKFTLHLPPEHTERSASAPPAAAILPTPAPATSKASPAPENGRTPPYRVAGSLQGDLGKHASGERRVLIVEDDEIFGKSLIDLAHDSGFKAVLATTGEAALEFAEREPVNAILLDMKLPDLSGLVVLERLKSSQRTRHVPVHVVSGIDHAQNALSLGAVGYLVKPAAKDQLLSVFRKIEGVLSTEVRHVLIVEDDQMQREAVRALLGNEDLIVDEAGTAREALLKLAENVYDCVVLDLKLPDLSGFELLERLDASPAAKRPPVVVYTGKDLSKDEQTRLERYAKSIIIKGARSPERLLDEVSLFLHRIEEKLPADSQALLQRLRAGESTLQGRKILIVDDDMRNVFALIHALEAGGMTTTVARNGQEALTRLGEQPDLDLVLMDIMMPVMDGYEAMGRIREQERFKKLPIIALTAKAMKGDMDQCLAAGANDYLPKPIRLEQLMSLLKVWLPQRV